jgi:hypothetical protein
VTRKDVARPSGMPPPTHAYLQGTSVELTPLADEIARRHLERHPEDTERYGDRAREWAIHDQLHVLHWAFGDHAGILDLRGQVAWLARVLEARGYPPANLWSCLRTAAEVVEERLPAAQPVAARLRAVADEAPR